MPAATTSVALAQPDPSGIDFVAVGSPNNPAYHGPDVNNAVTGRGAVPWQYKIGQTEVTTGQWMEFYNTFYGRAPGLNTPASWGAVATGNPNVPFRLSTQPSASLWPVSGVTWRTSAMFCNWLHNDKRTDIGAIQNGAYDISTFGNVGNVFTDQRQHNPDARYWIPTLDEWLKAAYYDPNYGGQNVGGWWWKSVNGTNTDLVYGPPGQGQANTGFMLPNGGESQIPLGAYPGTRSPWGMLDAAGATREFTESVFQPDDVPYRLVAGSHWYSWFGGDEIYGIGGTFPSTVDIDLGFRVAAAVPSSGTVGLVMVCFLRVGLQRNRK